MTQSVQPGIEPSKEIRLGFLDGMRGLAALYVLVYHLAIGSHAYLSPTRLFTYGHQAVTVFIVLSGFSLMLPVARNAGVPPFSHLQFFERRAWRILPTYYAALALSVLVDGGLNHWLPGSIPVHDLVGHLLLLQDVRPTALGIPYDWNTWGINFQMWSVAVEWHIYFLFPFIVLTMRRWGALWASLAMTMLWYGIAWAAARTLWQTPYQYYPAEFTLGMAAASLAFDPKHAAWRARARWLARAPIAAVIYAAAIFLLGDVRYAAHEHWIDLGTGIVFAAMLIALSISREGWLQGFLSSRALAFLGAMSYSLYLVQGPLLDLAHRVLPPVLIGPAVFVAAWLFSLAFEQPVSVLRKRLFWRKRIAPARMAMPEMKGPGM